MGSAGLVAYTGLARKSKGQRQQRVGVCVCVGGGGGRVWVGGRGVEGESNRGGARGGKRGWGGGGGTRFAVFG